MITVKSKWICLLFLSLFLTVSTLSLPLVQAQEDTDMGMMSSMMGMFMSLDVTVSAATNKLQDENATIYVAVSTSGAPVFAENLSIWMLYDDGDDWEENDPPVPWGFWEIQLGEDVEHGSGLIWHGGFEDPDTAEWVEIPGLYAINWVQGWLPGDYLITAYAEANMSELMEMGQVDQTEEMGDMFTNMTMRGYGSFCITVSETLTIAAYTTIGMAEGLEELGVAMAGFQTAFEEMAAFQIEMSNSMASFQSGFTGMEEFQADMAEVMAGFESSFADMTAFQDDMAMIFENMTAFQDALGSSMESFVEVLESSRVDLGGRRIIKKTVGTDVGEMIVALPLLYEEAQHIQQVTSAGIPIAYMLSAIAAIAAIIAVIFLVTLRRELRYRIRVSAR
jgi:hypothetical protein